MKFSPVSAGKTRQHKNKKNKKFPGFRSLVSRQPPHLHTQAEYGVYIYEIPPEFRGGVHLFI